MDKDRQVAIVTGGGAGIGQAIALRLAKAGYAVAVADVDAHRANRVTQQIREIAGQAEAVVCDVGERTQAFQMVEAATQALGDIHLLVNNAGIVRLGPLADFSAKDWRELFRVNVDGVLYCCQAVLSGMGQRQQGIIVNIASWNGSWEHPTSEHTAQRKRLLSR